MYGMLLPEAVYPADRLLHFRAVGGHIDKNHTGAVMMEIDGGQTNPNARNEDFAGVSRVVEVATGTLAVLEGVGRANGKYSKPKGC